MNEILPGLFTRPGFPQRRFSELRFSERHGCDFNGYFPR